MAIDSIMDQEDHGLNDELFSELMVDLLKWAKAEDFDPSVEGFKRALAPIYGEGQTNFSLMTHVCRILVIVADDARFRHPLDATHLEELLCAPYRRVYLLNRHKCEDEKVTLDSDELVAGYVAYLANLIRNSPTGRLTGSDFQRKIDPVVLTLMKYVKSNGTKELTLKDLGRLLEPHFGHRIGDLADLTLVVLGAYDKATKEPRFKLPQVEVGNSYHDILLAPVSGPHSLLGFGRRYSDLRRVEDFYMAMIKTVMGRFAVAKVDWCSEYFPNAK